MRLRNNKFHTGIATYTAGRGQLLSAVFMHRKSTLITGAFYQDTVISLLTFAHNLNHIFHSVNRTFTFELENYIGLCSCSFNHTLARKIACNSHYPFSRKLVKISDDAVFILLDFLYAEICRIGSEKSHIDKTLDTFWRVTETVDKLVHNVHGVFACLYGSYALIHKDAVFH